MVETVFCRIRQNGYRFKDIQRFLALKGQQQPREAGIERIEQRR
jgi:hypothetical protein